MTHGFLWERLGFWLNRFHGLQRVERLFAGVASPTFVKRGLFGFHFWVDLGRNATQQLLFLEGERFIDERFLLKRIVPMGAVVVDVGANIGYYLLLFEKQTGPTGHIICIEPSCENLPELKKNIEDNRFVNVDLFEVAVGARAEKVGLRSGINSGIALLGEGSYEVEMLPLDAVVGSRTVNFLKIDVEGFEGEVLEGAWGVIKRDEPTLFLEVHPHILGRFGHSTTGIVNRLREVYDKVEVYERTRHAQETTWQKIGIRYCGVDPLRRIADQETYLREWDETTEPHTFWLVASQ